MKATDTINLIIKNIDLGVGNIAVRIFLTVACIFFLFSALNLASSHHQTTAQISYIDRAFMNKEPRMMRLVISKCRGDFANPEIVKKCHYDTYNEMMQKEKRKRLKIRLYFIVWFIGLGVFSAGFSYLRRKQEEFRTSYQDEYSE